MSHYDFMRYCWSPGLWASGGSVTPYSSKQNKGETSMPCNSGPDDREIIHEQHKLIKDTETLLCSACAALERYGYNFQENPSLDRWWDAHKKADEARKIAEAAKRKEIELAGELVKKRVIDLTPDEVAIIRKHYKDFLR